MYADDNADPVGHAIRTALEAVELALDDAYGTMPEPWRPAAAPPPSGSAVLLEREAQLARLGASRERLLDQLERWEGKAGEKGIGPGGPTISCGINHPGWSPEARSP